jgi:hypothetical protein
MRVEELDCRTLICRADHTRGYGKAAADTQLSIVNRLSISRELGENRDVLQQQLDWLSEVSTRQHIVLVNAHDAAWLESLVEQGVLKAGLDLTAH